ncbi:hypothetical protein IQ277_17910 [Nostocales cyanobacterium LEGE 12452]|nr:hypothetical protein [Nostocales cyanobacterium LEGE 12452]
MSDELIWIVTDNTTQISDTQRSYREVTQELAVKVSVSELEQKMCRFLQSVSCLFKQAEQQTIHSSGILLDEIVLSVEISGEGEIKLMGTGGKAGSKGAITLKFKRLEKKSLN